MKIMSCVVCAGLLSTLIVGAQGRRPTEGDKATVRQARGFSRLRGPYLGQTPPGTTPRLFAPDAVSTAAHELNSVFTPDGNEFYFTIQGEDGRWTIMRTALENGRWTAPVPASFSGTWSDVDLFITADGRHLYFCSNRPLKGDAPKDFDIWMCERSGAGWGEPRNVGAPINSPFAEFYPTLTRDGTMYFQSQRPGGHGAADIWRSRLRGGQYVEAECLPAPVNTTGFEGDSLIAPDESYLIVSTRAGIRPPTAPGLCLSVPRPDGTWSPLVSLGEGVNPPGIGVNCEMLSPDGRYLFFTRGGDIYWVAASVIEEAKRRAMEAREAVDLKDATKVRALWLEFIAWTKTVEGTPSLREWAARLEREGIDPAEVRRRVEVVRAQVTEQPEGIQMIYDPTYGKPLTGNLEKDGFRTTPNAFLVEAAANIKAEGQALDVGAGMGRNAVHLGTLGWNVTGIDLSSEGLKVLQTNAAKAGLKVATVQTSYQDFDFGRSRWDLVAMILSWAPVEEPAFLARLKASIKPGGYVVFEHVLQRTPNPFPPGVHSLAPGQLRELFKDFEILVYREVEDSGDWGGAPCLLVRMVARKNRAETGAEQAPTRTPALDPATLRRAKDIARRSVAIDAHAHDPYKPASAQFPQQVTLPLMVQLQLGGLVQVVPFSQLPSDGPLDKVLADLRAVRKQVEADGRVSLALSAADFARARRAGRPAIMLGVEYFQGLLDARVDSLDIYSREGVRIVGLSHAGRDVVTEGEGATRRLTEFGLEAVAAMNRLGIACDVTHLPDAIRRQVIAASRAPILISHSAAFSLVPSPFNVDDETLDRLAAGRGLIGVTFCSEQLSRETLAAKQHVQDPTRLPPARAEDVVAQVDYLRKRVGLDSVALGSDFGGSGRAAPEGLGTVEGLPLVAYHMLKRGYSESDIAKILGGNFVRFIERVELAAKDAPRSLAPAPPKR